MSKRKTDEKKRENKVNRIREKAKGKSLFDKGYKILEKQFEGWIGYPELGVDEVSVESTTIVGKFRCSENGCNNYIRERVIKKVVEGNSECKCPECKKKISALRRTKTEAKRGNTIGEIAKQEGEKGERARQLIEQFIRFVDFPELRIEECNWTSSYEAEWICMTHKSPKCEKKFFRRVAKMTGSERRCECNECSKRRRKIKRIKYEGHKNPLKKSDVYEEITSGENGAKFVRFVEYPELSEDDVAVNSGLYAIWRCNCCKEEFEAIVSNRTIHKSGCSYCKGKKPKWGINDLYTYSVKYKPELIEQWDEEKNGKMEEYTKSSGKKVSWRCAKCGETFKRDISKMTGVSSNLCNRCAKRYSDSIPQQVIRFFAEKVFTTATVEYNCRSLEWLEGKELDIYLKFNEHQYAIEYDGSRHKVEKDIKKDRLCEKNECMLIRIRDPKAEKYQREQIGKNVKIINRETSLNDGDLERCIRQAFQFIVEKEKMEIGEVEIDIKSIVPQINHSMSNIVPREKSLAVLKPTAAKYLKRTLICQEGEINITATDVYANSNQPYIFHHYNDKTGKWHEWIQEPHNMKEPCNCQVCKNRYFQKGVNDFATLHPELMLEWDYEKNEEEEINPHEILGASGISANWICPRCGNKYKATLNSRVSKKSGCQCNRLKTRKRVRAVNLTTNEVIETCSEKEMAQKLGYTSHHIAAAVANNKIVGGSGLRKPLICRGTGEKYRSIKEASEKEGITVHMIKRFIEEGKTINGKLWEYDNEDKSWRIEYIY